MTPLITLGVMACILLTGRFLLSWQRPDQVDLAGKIRRRNGTDFGSLDEEPEKTTFLAKKEKELLQSGTGMTLPVYYLMIAATALVLYLLTDFLLASQAAAALVACASVFVPGYVIKQRKAKRKAEFDEAYVKALKRMASSLRTGSTLLQAVEDVVHTHALPRVIREELAAVLLDFEYHDTLDRKSVV